MPFSEKLVRIFCAALVALALVVPRASFADGGASQRIARLNEMIGETPDGPTKAALFLSRADRYRMQEDWHAALADIESASALDPEVRGIDRVRGLILFGAGRYHEATVAFKRHLRVQGQDEIIWIQLARSLARIDAYDDAVSTFTRVIELASNPGPDLYLERTDTIQAKGSTFNLEALRSIESGIERIGPVLSLELRALALEERLGLYNQALERVGSLARRTKSKAPWLLRKGQILVMEQRSDEAQRTLEEARRLAADATQSRKTRANETLMAEIDTLLATISNSPLQRHD